MLSPTDDAPGRGASDGSILRGMTVADQLLEARLDMHRRAAFAACEERIRERRMPVALVDVEHLFDGQSLFFYFLGEAPAELQALTVELAEVYDAAVQFRQFSDTLADGCGPGCGTADGPGGGCTSCAAGCAIGAACGNTPRKVESA